MTATNAAPSFEDMIRVLHTMRELVRSPTDGAFSPEEHEEMLDRIKSYCTTGIEKFKYSLAIPLFLEKYAETTDPYLREYVDKITNLVDEYYSANLRKSLTYLQNPENEKNFLYNTDGHLIEAAEIFYKKVLDKIQCESCLSDAGRSFLNTVDHIERYIRFKFNKTTLLTCRQGSWHGFYKYDVPNLVFDRKIPSVPPERIATIKAKIKQKRAMTRQYIAGLSMAKHNAVETSLHRQFDEVHRRMNIICYRRLPFAENLKIEKATLDKVYQNTLKANVETDRNLTRRKAKVLSQIESWVKKYDTDVANKMFELQEAEKQLEEQKIICKNFYAEYDRLAVEYAEVVAAQLEEERIAEEKAQMEAEAAARAAKKGGKK